jgi:hypothetical protein
LFEELPVPQERYAIAANALVPVPEPEQSKDFLSGKAALGKPAYFNGILMRVSCDVELFFSLDLWIHAPVLSTGRSISRPVTNGRHIKQLSPLQACPEHRKTSTQESDQAPEPPVPRQICQHPFLSLLALLVPKTFKRGLFVNMDV